MLFVDASKMVLLDFRTRRSHGSVDIVGAESEASGWRHCSAGLQRMGSSSRARASTSPQPNAKSNSIVSFSSCISAHGLLLLHFIIVDC